MVVAEYSSRNYTPTSNLDQIRAILTPIQPTHQVGNMILRQTNVFIVILSLAFRALLSLTKEKTEIPLLHPQTTERLVGKLILISFFVLKTSILAH